MKVYISGPISGVEHGNKTAFSVAAKKLFIAGHEAVNPINVGRNLERKLKHKPTWEEYMREDIKALMDCDAIYLLEDWQDSRGACLEKHIALQLGVLAIEPID